MRLIIIAALAALPLASAAAAGGYSYSVPHLTWPEPKPQPEVPTRLCAPEITITEESASSCAQSE